MIRALESTARSWLRTTCSSAAYSVALGGPQYSAKLGSFQTSQTWTGRQGQPQLDQKEPFGP
jgi:hypothetical protein